MVLDNVDESGVLKFLEDFVPQSHNGAAFSLPVTSVLDSIFPGPPMYMRSRL